MKDPIDKQGKVGAHLGPERQLVSYQFWEGSRASGS